MERKDMVMMKDGKMMLVRHDKIMPLEMDITMSDGTRVMMDGTVIMPDGTTRTMMEGESMTIDGQMGMKEEDMENKTDGR